MRVLVLGAGVLGSYLAHSLLKAGNDVTILARGKRYEQLSDNGLVIKHYFQKKTTVDRINVISELKKDVIYDLIFVVMKYNQLPSALLTIANNLSENIILIGNNANPKRTEADIQKLSKSKKNIGFGFQTSAGIREDSGRVISIHGKGNITFGDLNGDLSSDYKKLYYLLMKIYFKLPMNKFVSGGFDEIVALYNDFEKLKNNVNINMNNWNNIEKEALNKYAE